MTIITKMNMMLSLSFERLLPHRITTTSRFCYFSVSTTKKPSEEELVASFSSWNCIGSSHGWLGYMSSSHNSNLYLFKPSLINHPDYLPYISLPSYSDPISKMIFSSSPNPIKRLAPDNVSNNLSILIVLIKDFCYYAPAASFYRIGDPDWTHLSNFPVSQMPIERKKYLSSDKCFQDIAYDRKRNLFYVITNSGDIYSWDLSNYLYSSMKKEQDCSFQLLIKAPSSQFPSKKFYPENHLNEGIKYYLVMDESSGSLLMIRLLIYFTYFSNDKNPHFWDIPGQKYYTHDIYSLQFDNKLDLKWYPIIGLVDTALFIGRNNGIAVDARQLPGVVTPGYIYLACNAFGFFQLSALCFSSVSRSQSGDSICIIRAEKWCRDYYSQKSFPVWNFG